MIAVDSNVVLRRLLQDDSAQCLRVDRLFAANAAILITDIVLVEVAWTLAGKRYRAGREQIVAAIGSLMEEPNLVFEDRQVLWAALCDYAEADSVSTANGRRHADFADALLVRKALAIGFGRGVAAVPTYTFDVPCQQLPGARAL
ncbi:MAG: PIN domain nuclease [Xanthomonadales bacterium]|nr:PIN domain nuclease [Xanthomonadales bacterium]